ncbi:hypothetical protein GOBAR_AA22873 [Gossypium barbadense]|uniref:Uncharacterized protein n=1 Tax=Gossypium barbadense TaxID=3634 RepID=A0A2P5X373_GOSBA|nr:hypothetical protein GOBAR_AA22873 [Gossypium barbadense]
MACRATRVVDGRSKNEGPPVVGERQVDVAMEGVKIIVVHELLHTEPPKRCRTQVEGRVEFECELEVRRLDDLKKEPSWVSRQKGSDHFSQLDLFNCGLANAMARA